MITFSVTIFGQEKAEAGLTNIEQGITNLSPLFEKFGEKFHEEEREHLDRAAFAPLSPRYAEQKRLKYGGKPILQLTGRLYESLTEKGTAGSVYRISGQVAEFGTSVAHGLFHQTGTSRMPARPPLAEAEIDEYLTVASEYFDQVVRTAGFN